MKPNALLASLCLTTLALPLQLLAQGQDHGRGAGERRPMSWTGVLDEDSFAALHSLRADEAPPLRGRDIEVAGQRAYLSRPDGGHALGAVIVIHEWWGLNDHIKHWTDRLAADGYDALAVDLYQGTVATTREEALAAMRAVNEEQALATLRAAHHYLESDEAIEAERTACIGWCFGGGWSLRLAIAEPELDAAVVYYGRLIEDVDTLASIEAPLLGVFGNEDRGIPPESVAAFAAAMKEAGKSLELRQYDAQHAFANPSSAAYDAENAALAWRESRAFLARCLAPPQAKGRFCDGTRGVECATPEGWRVGDERQMRLETFVLDDGAECVVSAFPGDVGGLAANVARWYAQVGASPPSDDELAALPVTPMLGGLATVVRVEGKLPDAAGALRPAVLLGAIAPRDDEVVFVKLTGPTETVEDAQAGFFTVCRSLH